MSWGVKEWTDRFVTTMDDATSLRIMRGRAIAGAAGEIDVLDALLPDDVWVKSVSAKRDEYLDCLERIEARLDDLGLTYGHGRSYGISPEAARRVQQARDARKIDR